MPLCAVPSYDIPANGVHVAGVSGSGAPSAHAHLPVSNGSGTADGPVGASKAAAPSAAPTAHKPRTNKHHHQGPKAAAH